jgi:hypothetical protein
MSNDILFVLSQNKYEIEAVKTSNLLKIFKNIIFVEDELYIDKNLNVPQPVGNFGHLSNLIKINKFFSSIKENILNINKENIYVLAIQNYLLEEKTESEVNEVNEVLNIQLVHNDMLTFVNGGNVKFPKIYYEELKASSQIIGKKQDNSEDIIILGYDNTIGKIIGEIKDIDSDNWYKEFNNFDKIQQLRTIIDMLNFKPIIYNFMKNFMNNEENFDMSKSFSNITIKLMLRNIIENTLNNFINTTKINIDCVVGIEGNGYILGTFISDILNIPFVPIRLNTETKSESFEYDSYKIQQNLISNYLNILIVDDVITDGIKEKNICSLLNFFFPKITLFFTLDFNKENENLIKDNMGELVNNIIML